MVLQYEKVRNGKIIYKTIVIHDTVEIRCSNKQRQVRKKQRIPSRYVLRLTAASGILWYLIKPTSKQYLINCPRRRTNMNQNHKCKARTKSIITHKPTGLGNFCKLIGMDGSGEADCMK